MKIKLLISLFFSVAGLFIFANVASAQNVILVPSSGSITNGSSVNVQIRVDNPSAGQNAASIDLAIGSNLTVTNFTQNSDAAFLYAGPCAGGNYFSANQVCYSVSKTSDFADNDLLGTFTIQGTTVGSANITWNSGSELTDGVDSTTLSGTAGTYTITSGVGSLPSTDIGSKNYLPLAIAVLLILGGVSIYITVLSRKFKIRVE